MTLEEIFEEWSVVNQKIGLAFSGGVDSSYLLKVLSATNADFCAYYVKSEFQPVFEYEDALRLAKELGVKLRVINLSVLEDKDVCSNSSKRCYFCKKLIFNSIQKAALDDGCKILIDGTNASDDISDRPGFAALQELSVKSPLRDAGLTKNKIRRLSKEAGLFTWDKPAYACLATRIKTGNYITAEDLERTEKGEEVLFAMGFTDFRIRLEGENGKIQLPKNQIESFLEKEEEIIGKLKKYYVNIALDKEITR
ncbi:MAG: ATP-dependent sacrificial sulfur transferase LarE [Treponema sp.]|nr:ATP-dependent sacrificial sulfur transferase LarE [Treponema sp.]